MPTHVKSAILNIFSIWKNLCVGKRSRILGILFWFRNFESKIVKYRFSVKITLIFWTFVCARTYCVGKRRSTFRVLHTEMYQRISLFFRSQRTLNYKQCLIQHKPVEWPRSALIVDFRPKGENRRISPIIYEQVYTVRTIAGCNNWPKYCNFHIFISKSEISKFFGDTSTPELKYCSCYPPPENL